MSQPSESNSGQPAKPKVLLVDDNEAIRATLKAVLEMEGYEVTAASSSSEARNLVGLVQFRIAISDIKMPGECGLELLHFFRRSQPQLPIILMTGFSKMMAEKEAILIGAVALLAKPFTRQEVLNAIARAGRANAPKNLGDPKAGLGSRKSAV